MIIKFALQSHLSVRSSIELSESVNSATLDTKYIMASVFSRIWPNPQIEDAKAFKMENASSVQLDGTLMRKKFVNRLTTNAENGKRMVSVLVAIWGIPSIITNANLILRVKFQIQILIVQNGPIKSVISAPKELTLVLLASAYLLVTSVEHGITMMASV